MYFINLSAACINLWCTHQLTYLIIHVNYSSKAIGMSLWHIYILSPEHKLIKNYLYLVPYEYQACMQWMLFPLENFSIWNK